MYREALVCVLSTLFLGGGSAGCADPTSGCNCTAIHMGYDVSIVDNTGAPVSGLIATVTLVRTGQVLSSQGGVGNRYQLISDDYKRLLTPDGDLIRFTATDSRGTVTADYRVGVDSPCQCHVWKMFGPESLILQ